MAEKSFGCSKGHGAGKQLIRVFVGKIWNILTDVVPSECAEYLAWQVDFYRGKAYYKQKLY